MKPLNGFYPDSKMRECSEPNPYGLWISAPSDGAAPAEIMVQACVDGREVEMFLTPVAARHFAFLLDEAANIVDAKMVPQLLPDAVG